MKRQSGFLSFDCKISISFVSGFLLFVGILGIIAFAFGLSSGINILKRTHLVTSIVGLSVLLASGVMLGVSFVLTADLTNPIFPMSPIWIVGILTAILSILSLIFVAISRKEFS